MKTERAAQHVLEALGGGEPVAEAVVVACSSHEAMLGLRMAIWKDRTSGSLGTTELDRAATEAGREALRTRRAAVHRFTGPEGEVDIFIEPHHPPDELLIVGAGHIARPLCRLGAMLGFQVTVLDDRPGFATRERFPEAARLIRADFSDPFRGLTLGRGTHLILVTRGHKYDYDALRDVLLRELEVAYIGMVGSQRRVRAAFEQLVREGIDRERLAGVHAPIGLDIEAETPEEIAVSIAAELIQVRRGGTGTPLRDRARVIERWIRPAPTTAERSAVPTGSEEEV